MNNSNRDAGCFVTLNMNLTENRTEDQAWKMHTMAMTLGSMLTIGIWLANSLVIIAFVRNCYIRQTMMHHYILQLAATDFMTGLVLALHVVLSAKPSWLKSKYTCLVQYSSLMLVSTISMLSLLAITCDRFMSVAKPLYYRGHVNKKFIWSSIAVINILPLILCVLVPIFWHIVPKDNYCSLLQTIPRSYLASVIIPIFIMTAILTNILYGFIFHHGRVRLKNIEKLVPISLQRFHKKATYRVNMKMAQTGALVLGVFLFCYLPFFITLMVQVYGKFNSQACKIAQTVGFYLIMLNSVLNPIIYANRLPQFRDEFKRILCCLPPTKFYRRQSCDSMTMSGTDNRRFSLDVMLPGRRTSIDSGVAEPMVQSNGHCNRVKALRRMSAPLIQHRTSLCKFQHLDSMREEI